jgi:N6-adenosine-specific RNA methylase IME4
MKAEFLSHDKQPVHPVALLQPQMSAEQSHALVLHLQENGQIEPVLLYQGRVLSPDHIAVMDALHMLDRPILYKHFRGSINGILTPYLTSTTRYKFQVQATKESRAAWFLLAAEQYPDVGKHLDALRRASQERMNDGKKSTVGKTTAQAIADQLGCGARTIENVITIQKLYPQLLPRIAKGELTTRAAILEGAKTNKPHPLPDGKYRVIYADPPWYYASSDHYGGNPGDHYKMMQLQPICDMPVLRHAADDAVLFLWVTNMYLQRSFQVVEAWGFKFSTCFIWRKQTHARATGGNFVNLEHEYLFVCPRGKMLTPKKVFPSVIDYRLPKRVHSQKPREVREMIDAMYPPPKKGQDRLELFCRPGPDYPKHWKTYGNET